MRKIAFVLAAGAALVSASALHAGEKLSGEARLAKLLDGRVAGEPVSCIFMPRVRDTRIIDKTAIVYDGGSTIWINRPTSGAQSLDSDDVMVTRLTGAQLCSVDTVNLHDRSHFFWNGFVGLGDFVPYTRAKVAHAD
jgi:hypothetical protein